MLFSISAGHFEGFWSFQQPGHCSNIKAKLAEAIICNLSLPLLCLVVRTEAVVVTNAAGLSVTMDLNAGATLKSSIYLAPAWSIGGEIGSSVPLKTCGGGFGPKRFGRHGITTDFLRVDGRFIADERGNPALQRKTARSFFSATSERRRNAASTVSAVVHEKLAGRISIRFQLPAGGVRSAAVCRQRLFHAVAVVR